jgi:uncharacterized protein (TIGR02594 family)
MRAVFVACCLGSLVGVLASPVHARTFCKFEDCQQTSAWKVAPKHTAGFVQKPARKHTATPVRKLAPKGTPSAHASMHMAMKASRKHTATPVHKLAAKNTASAHAPKHTATKAASKHPVVPSATQSVRATRTVSHPHPLTSASRECAPSEVCDSVVSGGSQLIRVAMEHLGDNPTGWSHNWCGRFLAMTLEKAGHTGGGNLAASYADYGLPAKAQVGAIAVMPHHVGIVTAVGPNYVVLLSGNHGHKVGVGRYASNKIIAYRMAV